jgi:hypothetical protein
VQVNPLGAQQRAEPVPPTRGFDDGVMGAGKLGEVAPHGRGIVGEGLFRHTLPCRPDGGHGGTEPLRVDADALISPVGAAAADMRSVGWL